MVKKWRGPYADYAGELLGIENLISQNSTEYEITGMNFSSFIEPDPQQLYSVSLEEKSDERILISYSESGTLAGIEYLDENFSLDDFNSESISGYSILDMKDVFSKYSAVEMEELMDTIVRKLSIDTIEMEKMIFKPLLIKKSDQDKAREAAQLINSIRQDKYNLLIGYQETAYEKESMEFMLDKLDQMEQDYLKLFTGAVQTQSMAYKFHIVPENDDLGNNIPVAYFSEDAGLFEALTAGTDPIQLRVNLPENYIRSEKPAGITGFVYRVPVLADIDIVYDSDILFSSRELINQYGGIKVLPTTVTKVMFNPNTGAVKQMVLEN